MTPGERFKIRTSVEETEGAFATVELVADPRNGTPIHVHKNEDEHFIVLEGTLHIANGDKTLDAPAGTKVIPTAFTKVLGRSVQMQIVSRESWEGLFQSQGMKNPLPRIQMLMALTKAGSSSRAAKPVLEKAV